MVPGEEPPKCVSSGPSHLPLQVKAGRAPAGYVKGRAKFSFWQIISGGGTRYRSDSSWASELVLQLVLIPSSNKKLLQSGVPVLSASLQAYPPFVFPMKKYIYFTSSNFQSACDFLHLLHLPMHSFNGLFCSLDALRFVIVCNSQTMEFQKNLRLVCPSLPENWEDTSHR